MKNMTITVREDVARWARVWAARHGTSVSRMVGEVLERFMREEDGYASAMKRFLGRKPRRISGGRRYPSRTDLHERDLLR